jgi:hypothetical protein
MNKPGGGNRIARKVVAALFAVFGFASFYLNEEGLGWGLGGACLLAAFALATSD